MLQVACKDKHERNHQEFFRPFSVVWCVMQLLYFLGSLCHLTTVWSQQKSTIFAFQQFSPTVSLWRVWKCDQCGVYRFAPRQKNGTNWPFGSSADWRRGPLQRAVGVHCCRRVRVMMDGREGGGLGKGAGPRGCGSGLISSQRSHQSAKNGPISVNPKWNVWVGGERCRQCQTHLIILPAFHFF